MPDRSGVKRVGGIFGARVPAQPKALKLVVLLGFLV